MHRMGIESALAEYRPVIMSVPAGPLPMQTPMLPATARYSPGHVAGAFHVTRQDMADAAMFFIAA